MEARPTDAGLKLWRAHEHLQDLEAEIEGWLELKPYRVWKEREPETDYFVVYAEPVAEVPLELPAIIGDVLQNLRACLDHVAFRLSERGYGGPLPENLARTCHFPISDSAEKFAATVRSNVPHIAAKPLAFIESVQPYWSDQGIEGAELTVLKKLAEFDKHRSLPVVVRNATVAEPLAIALGELHMTHLAFVGSLDRKTALWRYRSVPELEVDVEDGFTCEICFGDAAPARAVGREIVTGLSHLWMFVGSEIVRPLNPYLE